MTVKSQRASALYLQPFGNGTRKTGGGAQKPLPLRQQQGLSAPSPRIPHRVGDASGHGMTGSDKYLKILGYIGIT